jgi:kojibiose phosphorylase
LVQRITLTPDRKMALEIFSGIHTACCNLPVADDQTKENTETVQLITIEQKNVSGLPCLMVPLPSHSPTKEESG